MRAAAAVKFRDSSNGSVAGRGYPARDEVLHVLALLTAVAMFPLICMGGLVTSHNAGMSVPDWPNTYGYNMFLFPPRLWIGGIFYEHTHRLMAATVAIFSAITAIWAWRRQIASTFRRSPENAALSHADSRSADRKAEAFARLVRWLCLSLFLAVMVQAVLGGLRVTLVALHLAMIHACFAQAVFCVAALTVMLTGKWWPVAPDLSATPQASYGRTLRRLAYLCVVVVFVQLMVGAVMRHERAGLAIPGISLSANDWLPPISVDELDAARQRLVHEGLTDQLVDLRLPMWKAWLHETHRAMAMVVSILAIAICVYVFRRLRDVPKLAFPSAALAILVAAQVALGLYTIATKKAADVASAHVGVGALVLLTSFIIAARARRLYSPRTSSATVADGSESAASTQRSPAADRQPEGHHSGPDVTLHPVRIA